MGMDPGQETSPPKKGGGIGLWERDGDPGEDTGDMKRWGGVEEKRDTDCLENDEKMAQEGQKHLKSIKKQQKKA